MATWQWLANWVTLAASTTKGANMAMTKNEAIELLGGTPNLAAKALGYTVVQTVYSWPDELPQALEDRVRGAAARLKLKPKKPQAHTQQA
jgi:hypothetical protein